MQNKPAYRFLKKRLIRETSKVLSWQTREVEDALLELSEQHSIVKNWSKFFKLCLDTRSPNERMAKINQFLKDNLKSQDVVRTVCDLLYNPDPCFSALCIFNGADIGRTINKEILWPLHLGRKSFLVWTVFLGEQPLTLEKDWRADPRFDAYELCADFLHSFVIRETEESANLESLFFDVVGQIGFLVFKVAAFRNIASRYSYDPTKKKELAKLALALRSFFSSGKKKRKQIEYWLQYVLVEKLKERHGTMTAFQKAAKLFYKGKATTIARRYYEMSLIASGEKLTVDKIISKYRLREPLDEYLLQVK